MHATSNVIWSGFVIKKVAPVLLGNQASYHHLAIGDGIEAMLSYQEMLISTQTIQKKKKSKKTS